MSLCTIYYKWFGTKEIANNINVLNYLPCLCVCVHFGGNPSLFFLYINIVIFIFSFHAAFTLFHVQLWRFSSFILKTFLCECSLYITSQNVYKTKCKVFKIMIIRKVCGFMSITLTLCCHNGELFQSKVWWTLCECATGDAGGEGTDHSCSHDQA